MDQDIDGICISQLNGLIKQKRNDEIKTILLKDASCNLIDKQESTVIRTAVMFDNIDVIAYLFTFGFDINARDSTGQTPLLLAAKNNFFRAFQLLLTLDADALITDNNGQNTLQVLLQEERNVPKLYIGMLIERLKTSGLSSDNLAKELIEADYPLEHVFTFNDPEITKGMITRTDQFTKELSCTLITCAMSSGNINNVKVLIKHGQENRILRKMFMIRVQNNILDPSMSPFIQKIVDWNLIDDEFLRYSDVAMNNFNKDIIEIYLDGNVDKYCREKFGWELLFSLFGNKNVDVTEILKNREFNVNGRNNRGNSALHLAALYGNENLITYLLDNGADPNIKDNVGETPIFYTHTHYKIGELLLEAGANLQVLNNNGLSAVKYYNESAVANIMILSSLDVPINEKIRKSIFGLNEHRDFDENFQNTCSLHYQDLEWMKTRQVTGDITLFSVLTEKFERLAKYVKDNGTYEKIVAMKNELSLKQVYDYKLMRNLERARKFSDLKLKAAKFLCSVMQIAYYDHLVISIIIGFLTYKDLFVFNNI